jgi:hypothetical protein
VLFGLGTFTFEYHPLLSSDAFTNIPTFGTGDFNSDGHSDVFFIEGASDRLYAYMGDRDRTFALATSDTPSLDELQYDALVPGTFTMADFNGDGRMDLVAYARNSLKIRSRPRWQTARESNSVRCATDEQSNCAPSLAIDCMTRQT